MSLRRQGGADAEVPEQPTLDDIVFPDFMPQDMFEEGLSHAKTEVNVAVAGVTGSGKSTLINTLCNNPELAKEGDLLSAETKKVESYTAQTSSLHGKNFAIKVWDSPGLKDGSGGDRAYMQRMHEKVRGGIDMLLYCVNASVTRCVVEEMVPGMAAVTQALGPDIWSHAMIILTFANEVADNTEEEGDDAKYFSDIKHWKEKVHVALREAGVPVEVAENVPVEPAGYYREPSLPTQQHWLGDLWIRFVACTRDEAQLAMIITNQHYIRDADSFTPRDALEEQDGGNNIPIAVNGGVALRRIGAGTPIGAGMIEGGTTDADSFAQRDAHIKRDGGSHIPISLGAGTIETRMVMGGVTGKLVMPATLEKVAAWTGVASGGDVRVVVGGLVVVAVYKAWQKKLKQD